MRSGKSPRTVKEFHERDAEIDTTGTRRQLIMREVYIIAVGMTRFGKHLDKTEKDLTAEAFARTIPIGSGSPVVDTIAC